MKALPRASLVLVSLSIATAFAADPPPKNPFAESPAAVAMADRADLAALPESRARSEAGLAGAPGGSAVDAFFVQPFFCNTSFDCGGVRFCDNYSYCSTAQTLCVVSPRTGNGTCVSAGMCPSCSAFTGGATPANARPGQ